MLIDGATSLLVVSIDTVPDKFKGQVDYLSLSSFNSNEAAQEATDEWYQAFIRSDAKRLINRIPIPINDELLPIVQMGTDSRMTANVQKLTVNQMGQEQQQEVFTPSRNTLSLSFRMLSKLGTVSTIADIVNALGLISSVVPVYCSWFSKTDCIFNARLVGIGRSSEKNSDMEALTLNLERAPNQLEPATTPEGTPSKLEQKTQPDPIPPTSASAAGVRLAGYAEATQDDIRAGWLYYDLGTIPDLLEQPVPYLAAPFTVQRQQVEIYLVRTTYQGGRDIQGVKWLGKYLTLEQSKPFVYGDGLALVRFANRLWVGVPE